MQQEYRCFFCGDTIIEENFTLEHIIPNAIGGRRKVGNFICKKCNNSFGQTWDNVLTEQFKELCFFLNIKRERGEVQPIVGNKISGEEYLLKINENMVPRKPYIEQKKLGNGSIEVIATVATEKQMRQLLKSFEKKGYKISKQEIKKTREYLKEPLKIPMHFGGQNTFKSIAKTCIALAVANKFDCDYHEIKEILCTNKNLEQCGVLNEDYIINRNDYKFFHCVHVRGSTNTHQLFGYVEYFSAFKFFIVLSNSYQGEDKECTYAIDPITGKEIFLRFKFPCQKIEYTKTPDRQQLRETIGRLIEYYLEKEHKKVQTEIIETSLNEALAICNIKEGDRITRDFIDTLLKIFERKFAPYIAAHYGAALKREEE